MRGRGVNICSSDDDAEKDAHSSPTTYLSYLLRQSWEPRE